MKIIKTNPILTIDSEDDIEVFYKYLKKWLKPNKKYRIIGYIYQCFVVEMEIEEFEHRHEQIVFNPEIQDMFCYDKNKYRIFLLNKCYLNDNKVEELLNHL